MLCDFQGLVLTDLAASTFPSWNNALRLSCKEAVLA